MSRNAPPPKKKPGVRIEDVAYYFDGVERDRLDATGTSRKCGEVLALRDRLLKLPDEEFEATIKTVKGLLIEEKGSESEAEGRAKRRSQAAQLFESSRSSSGGGASRTGKVAPT